MQMQQQLQEMGAQVEQLQNDKANMQQALTDARDTIGTMSARGANPEESAIIEASRNTMGVPTGAALPT